MTKEGAIFIAVIAALVLGGCLLAFIISVSSKPFKADPQDLEPPKPRIILPTDCNVYTVTLRSQLKPEEWQMILNAGWTLLTCNTEDTVEYAGCYPDAPRYHCTRWHYAFRRGGAGEQEKMA